MMIFLRPGLLHRVDNALILPGVDEGAVDRLLVRKDILQALDELAAAVLKDRGQDGRHAEDLGRLGQRDDVVHDHRRLVAVQIGELERLVVDQHQHGFFRGEQGVEAVLGGVGLGWSWALSPVGVASSAPSYRPFIDLGLVGNDW